jgi:hypothetical protein
MHHITRAAAAIAIAVAITAAGPAAFAETTSAEDPRGDARRAFDITNIRLANNERAVRIRLDFVGPLPYRQRHRAGGHRQGTGRRPLHRIPS